MIRSARTAAAVSAALASGICILPALAQEPNGDRKITVMTRPKPELDPLGVRMGSFILFPKLSVAEEYTDNVYKTDEGTRDDFVLHLAPGFRVESDWSSHAVEAGVDSDIAIYAENESEDYEDVSAYARGRLAVTHATNLLAGAVLESLHEDRGSPEDVAGRRPTEYDRLAANLGVSHRFNRLNVEAETQFVQLDFEDVRAAGGAEINNDDRDRDVYLASARAGYEIVPRYEAFLRGVFNQREYDAPLGDLGFNRDSHGYDVVVGTEFDLTGITFGEVHLGYREQIYEDSRFDTLSGISYGARLTSNVTPLTTLQLFVDREIEETSVTTAEGYWSTDIRLTADHELLRNLILSARLGYGLAEYEGIDRDDDVYTAGLSATYQMNRHLGVTAGYSYEERASSGLAAGEDYSENEFLIRITGRL